MPLDRLIGNAGLSFLAKISSGYWHTFDPTNGFIAIHASLVELLPLDKIAKHFFFGLTFCSASTSSQRAWSTCLCIAITPTR